MDDSREMLIAYLLGAGAVAVILFEIVKKMEPEVTAEKLAALGIAFCYLLAACFSGGITAVPSLGVWLLFSLGLIWFGDEIGSLTGLKMGLVDRASPGPLVRLTGWLFLLLPLGLMAFCW